MTILEALKELYVAEGGSSETVEDVKTIANLILALSDLIEHKEA